MFVDVPPDAIFGKTSCPEPEISPSTDNELLEVHFVPSNRNLEVPSPVANIILFIRSELNPITLAPNIVLL